MTSRVNFQSGPLVLEGMLHRPSIVGLCPAVVVCHPHPLFGGNMRSIVVEAVCEDISSRGWMAFRFNFRGVAGSKGVHSGGKLEHEDVIGALDYLAGLEEVDRARLSVVGYSFGAAIGVVVAHADDRVNSLAAISLPPRIANFALLNTWRRPKLFIWGDDDEFVDSDLFQERIGELPDPKQYRVFPGVDHLWAGRHQDAAKAVGDFLTENN